MYLRNSKHVPYFYLHKNTSESLGEREMMKCFHSFFEFSQTFTSDKKSTDLSR